MIFPSTCKRDVSDSNLSALTCNLSKEKKWLISFPIHSEKPEAPKDSSLVLAFNNVYQE